MARIPRRMKISMRIGLLPLLSRSYTRTRVSLTRARKFVTRQITRIHCNAVVDEQIPGTRQLRPVNKIYKRYRPDLSFS